MDTFSIIATANIPDEGTAGSMSMTIQQSLTATDGIRVTTTSVALGAVSPVAPLPGTITINGTSTGPEAFALAYGRLQSLGLFPTTTYTATYTVG